jgi:NAD(P)-dependent dehydrogenase (short-subunit alcohol dehydrogenase family)
MALKSVLITGCNRVIGLELVKQYAALENWPQHIFATYRKMSDELASLGAANPKIHLCWYARSNIISEIQ